jgi:hypothetical protein
MNDAVRVVKRLRAWYVRLESEASNVESHISKEQREVLVEAIRRLGVTEVAKRLGLSGEATCRVAGDFGCNAGTECQAAQRLERLK